jgi:hypothetical protein
METRAVRHAHTHTRELVIALIAAAALEGGLDGQDAPERRDALAVPLLHDGHRMHDDEERAEAERSDGRGENGRRHYPRRHECIRIRQHTCAERSVHEREDGTDGLAVTKERLRRLG